MLVHSELTNHSPSHEAEDTHIDFLHLIRTLPQSALFGISVLALDLLVRVGLSIRVIMRRRPVGVTLAWLVLLVSFPFFGALVYLLVGERWLGRRRLARVKDVQEPFRNWLANLADRPVADWTRHGDNAMALGAVAQRTTHIPALAGNRWELLTTWEEVFRRIVEDIDSARSTIHLEFYIWNEGGMVNEVTAALLRAAQRGVTCRVLVDAMGSRDFLNGPQRRELTAGGVDVRAALPGGMLRMLFERVDLRLHRKIVVIDGKVGYTGSLNLVDPRTFKQNAGVGQWVDAMTRIEGPAIEALAVTFIADWAIETAAARDSLLSTSDIRPLPIAGNAVVQVCASGPTGAEQAIYEVLLTAIYSARRELILTSPYFVPDEPLVLALIAAAHRGVDVTLIVPARVDSLLVRLASQTSRGDLANAGVKIREFLGGLLHTKSVTIDAEYSLFGSLNLDPRSLYLNFEITLAVYDIGFTRALRDLQHVYLREATAFDIDAWNRRPAWTKFTWHAGRLLSPLL